MDQIRPITEYGLKTKLAAKPFIFGQENELKHELEKVEIFTRIRQRRDVIDILKCMKNISQTVLRAKKNNILDEVELFEIKVFLMNLEKMEKSLRGSLISKYEDLLLHPMPHLIHSLDPLDEKIMTFYIYDEYSKLLESIRYKKKETELNIKEIKSNIKDDLQHKYNVKFNLKDEIIISKSDKDKISELNNNENLRICGENYLNIFYQIKNNDELDNLEKILEELIAKEEAEELLIRKNLSLEIKKYYDDFVYNMDVIGKLDYIIAKANYAQKTNSVMPDITTDRIIEIINGRNLKLEDTLKQKKKNYTKVSVKLKQSVACITGANMGGKTVSLRMIGQIAASASYGMFVPCESAKICLFNHIHISVGDDQSIEKGLSTFGAEIINLKYALENANDKSLILIDELAGGTNPKEGFAITKSVVDYLKKSNSITVLTTHYDNVADDTEIQNLQVAGLKLPDNITEFKGIDEISKYMDYTLVEVRNKSFTPRDALNIAKLAGIQPEIIKGAEQYL